MINHLLAEMEMKRLHMGTMSFGADTMDEVTHQLATAFGASADQGWYLSSKWWHITHNARSVFSAGGRMPTGAQLATRGRRDMSSRVRDIVLSLALCHNVSMNRSPRYVR
jgi:phospholipid-translocating ATPase